MKKYYIYGCGLLLVGIVCAILTGCGTKSSETPATTATASTSAPTGKNAGRLMIQRAASMGADVVLNISVDGKQVAALGAGKNYSGSLSSGEHVVAVAIVPNPADTPITKKTLTIEAGQTQSLTAVWKGRKLVLE